MATGFGLTPVRHRGGAPYSGQANRYFMPATDASAIGIGEVMKLVNAMDGAGEFCVVAQAAAGDAPIGVIVGIEPAAGIPLANAGGYRPASVACYVWIADDPDLIFQGQEDAVGGAVTAAFIGEHRNIDLVVVSTTANVTTGTGLSKTMLDSSTAVATALPFKIVGVKKDLSNSAALTAGSILEVVILTHALTVTDSVV